MCSTCCECPDPRMPGFDKKDRFFVLVWCLLTPAQSKMVSDFLSSGGPSRQSVAPLLALGNNSFPYLADKPSMLLSSIFLCQYRGP